MTEWRWFERNEWIKQTPFQMVAAKQGKKTQWIWNKLELLIHIHTQQTPTTYKEWETENKSTHPVDLERKRINKWSPLIENKNSNSN